LKSLANGPPPITWLLRGGIYDLLLAARPFGGLILNGGLDAVHLQLRWPGRQAIYVDYLEFKNYTTKPRFRRQFHRA